MNQSELFDDTESSVPFIDLLGAAKTPAATQHGNNASTQDGSQNLLAPSPKRARSRKSMAPPTVPRASAGRTTRNSTQGGRGGAVKRQPLRAVDGNVSPSKSGVVRGTSFKGLDEEGDGHAGGFEDTTTFDGSEVFTSTPGIAGGHGDREVLPDDDTEMI